MTRNRKTKQPPRQDQVNQAMAVTDFDISGLPTGGIGYPENTKMSFRTYTFGEIKKSSGSSKNVITSLKMALSCLNVEGIDKMQLSVMDVFFLGLLIKSSSLGGEKFELPFLCPVCGTQSKVVLTQSDIVFKELDDRILELPIEAEIGGKMLKFAPMTVKQYIELYSGVYDQILKDGEPDAIAVYSMLNKGMTFKESYDFLYGLTDADDIETMAEIDKCLMHNLEPVTTKCESEKCGTTIAIKMEGKEALLRPFRSGKRSDRPRIFFKSPSAHQPTDTVSNGVPNSASVEQETNGVPETKEEG